MTRLRSYGAAAAVIDISEHDPLDEVLECIDLSAATDDGDDTNSDNDRNSATRERRALLKRRRKARPPPPPPPSAYPWWSRLFFSWCEPLARICEQRPLRYDDFWVLHEHDTSLYNANAFKRALATTRSIVVAAIWTQWRLMLASGALSLAAVVCELTGPIAVYRVVDAAANGQFATVDSTGVCWTLVLLASRFLRSYALAWAEHLLRFVDVRVSCALQVLLLERALTLRDSTVQSANLFTIDVASVSSGLRVAHRLWMAPLELFGLFSIFRYVAGHVITGILLASLAVYAVLQLAIASEASVLKQWLSISDVRFRVLERVFHHILAIKLSSWEDWALARVLAVRQSEQRVLQRHVLLRTLRYTLTWLAPSLNLIATGVLLVNVPNDALASPAFTFSAVAIFHAINDTFTDAVAAVQVVSQFRVSLERINNALQLATPAPPATLSNASTSSGSHHSHTNNAAAGEDAITVVCASFTSATSSTELLANVTLRIQPGEFVVVYGRVGCGKSVLLSALLGFLPKTRGGVYLHGRVAYCSQVPWLQRGSIRDNVLFGRTFDAQKYWSVLAACCLLDDLAQLPAGDCTRVGSHGLVSLSSGQQARVALARAAYADADIYILDAPLDSVDSIVQCDVLLKCLGQLLQRKTVVLATHNPEVIRCEYVDRAIEMDRMKLLEPPRAAPAPPRQRFVRCAVGDNAAAAANRRAGPQPFRSKRTTLLGESAMRGGLLRRRRDAATTSTTANTSELLLTDAVMLDPRVVTIETATGKYNDTTTAHSTLSPTAASTYVNHASCAYREKGGWSAVLREYIAYTQSFSTLCVVVVLHQTTQVLSTVAIYCFSRWIASTGATGDAAHTRTLALFARYMYVVAASCVAYLGAAFATFSFSLSAADRLFTCMTSALLHAPLSFFATHSVGRVLNRYARDLRAVDSSLQCVVFALLRSFFSSYCSLFASLAWLSGHVLKLYAPSPVASTGTSGSSHSTALWTATWWLVMLLNVTVTTGVLAAFWRDGIRANKPSGEIYLMFRETQSPLFSYVAESMSGARVVAAYGAETQRFVAQTYGLHVDRATRVLLAMWAFETFVALRCLLLESLLTAALLIALIGSGHDASVSNEPATIGLLLFLLLNLREDLKHSFANWNLLEKDLACVQRILEYIDVKPDGGVVSSSAADSDAPVDPFWPRHGAITFEHVYFQYDNAFCSRSNDANRQSQSTTHRHDHRPSTDGGTMALRNVSFTIAGGEKIGVVGRSGAGKSSLAMALMRVVDPIHGTIRIDGVDITQLHVKTLRSKISYVPPNPVFVNATLREYLDPLQHVDDAALWRILHRTGVEVSIRKLQATLDTGIMDMVGTWSSGERQLLCLSRALVFRSRIVILDEATTATDQETDGSVQDLVYELLDSSTTLLCIAHRLDTVLEFDKILVMADGSVEDFGTVQELVAAGDGVFYNLLESAQLVY